VDKSSSGSSNELPWSTSFRCPKATSPRGLDLASNEDELLGGGNCNPKTE
jgi:hypothetical protein